MALILAINTATSATEVALVDPGRLVVERLSSVQASHAASLPQLVAECLEEAHAKVADLSLIALGAGPGSFTGLRIGFSFAKGLALSASLPIFSVPSFEPWVVEATPQTLTITMLDARREEFFCSAFRGESLIWGAEILTAQALWKRVLSLETAGEIQVLSPEEVSNCPFPVKKPERSAWKLAQLAVRRAKNEPGSCFVGPAELSSLVPRYVRAVSAKTIAERTQAAKV